MRPSPLQLKNVIYTKISVLPNTELKRPPAAEFDFDGVNVHAKVGTGLVKGQEADPRDFLIELEIGIDNKEGKSAPYRIDIGIIGIFNVLPSLPKEKREDLVTVNGASILYGAIREMVLSLTSRFPLGPMTLPGMNFEDSAPSEMKKAKERQAIAEAPARATSSVKKAKKRST